MSKSWRYESSNKKKENRTQKQKKSRSSRYDDLEGLDKNLIKNIKRK